jgi:hypothetical protein
MINRNKRSIKKSIGYGFLSRKGRGYVKYYEFVNTNGKKYKAARNSRKLKYRSKIFSLNNAKKESAKRYKKFYEDREKKGRKLSKFFAIDWR